MNIKIIKGSVYLDDTRVGSLDGGKFQQSVAALSNNVKESIKLAITGNSTTPPVTDAYLGNADPRYKTWKKTIAGKPEVVEANPIDDVDVDDVVDAPEEVGENAAEPVDAESVSKDMTKTQLVEAILAAGEQANISEGKSQLVEKYLNL